jgi:hypothetical protein
MQRGKRKQGSSQPAKFGQLGVLYKDDIYTCRPRVFLTPGHWTSGMLKEAWLHISGIRPVIETRELPL